MAAPLSSFGATLFQQTITDADGYFSDATSSNGAYFWQQAMAEDFTLSANSNVTSIVFSGASENFDGSDNLDNFSSFDVVIYDTNFNVVNSANYSLSSLNATANGVSGSFTDATGYNFTATTNLNLAAGTYWLHVGAVLVDGGGNAFQWSSADGNTNFAADFFDGSGYSTFAAEPGMAFAINGTTVPEPASMVALGLGAAAFLRRRRKA